jgi:malonyl-CoA decarboxylase
MRRSAGLMVNYVYRLEDVERNHEVYARERQVVAARRFEVLARESLAVQRETAPQPAHA